MNSAELRRVPPLGWLAVGLLVQKVLPGGRRSSRTSAGLAGLILSACFGLLAWAVTAFRRHETTVDPLAPEKASSLLSDGPFRVTRNPMYVAMAGVLVASAVARRSLLGLLPAAAFALVINKAQIEAEEHSMAANFGADWEQYAATTPRWLDHRSLRTRKLSAKRRYHVALALTTIVGLGGCAGESERAESGTEPVISTPSSGGTPAPDATAMPRWPAPTDVAERVAAAGLDLGPMGTAEHYHPQLRIVIDGVEVPVPPNIGVDPATGAMSALHSHEGDGTIHIEADSVGEVFTLGQFFTQWGVALSPQQIGGVRAKPGQQVVVTSNGAKVTGSPADVRLEPDQQILLTLQ